jgi:hypothetical protein
MDRRLVQLQSSMSLQAGTDQYILLGMIQIVTGGVMMSAVVVAARHAWLPAMS